MTTPYDAFISYSRHDQVFVRKLVDRLKKHGISIFYDEADIALGDSLIDSLSQAIQNAKYVLVVMSPDYFAGSWATKELDLARNQEFENKQTKVIPLLYRSCEDPSASKAKSLCGL